MKSTHTEPVDRPIVHTVYFVLADRSADAIRVFSEACVSLLSGHDGQTRFALGTRALNIRRTVSALDYDIMMTMTFVGMEALDEYQRSPRHDEFITATAGMSTDRTVYDSFVDTAFDAEELS